MDTALRCAALAAAGALLAMTVRRQSPGFGALTAVAVLLALGTLTLELLGPVLDLLETLRDQAKLTGGLLSPVLKTMAIGCVTETGGSICEEAGEKTVSQGLRMAGTAAAFYALLPLIRSVLDLLEQLL